MYIVQTKDGKKIVQVYHGDNSEICAYVRWEHSTIYTRETWERDKSNKNTVIYTIHLS